MNARTNVSTIVRIDSCSSRCFRLGLHRISFSSSTAYSGASVLGSADSYGSTRKFTLLVSVPLGVTTSTLPVVAPLGTVVVISELETTSKTDAVPLNVTLLAPVRSVPRMLTDAPTVPDVVCVSTNGPSPNDRLKTVPQAVYACVIAVQ